MTYGYNANGWLTNLSDWGTNTIVSYEYDAAGRRTKRTLQNSTFTDYHYDVAGQLTNIVHRQNDLSLISSNAYGYDAAGQRTWVKRGNGKGDVYKYDATGQLTNVLYEATNPDATPSAWTNEARYVFDAAGNRTSVNLTNTGTTSYTANALNQYTDVGGAALGYDKNGNPTNDLSWWYYYDRDNLLLRATNGTVGITNVYDVFKRLVQRRKGAEKTRFIYDHQWRVMAEYNEVNGSLLAKYVYGPEIDEPVRMTRGGTNYYYHAAALGTVTEITSTNGTIMESYRYDVYGEPTILSAINDPLSTSAIGNRFLFQGRDRDPDTGLYNFRHRYYSPTLGRFVQVDPIRFLWLNRDPKQELGGSNLYASVANDPIDRIDPFGFSVTWYGTIRDDDVPDSEKACFNSCVQSLDAVPVIAGALGGAVYGLSAGAIVGSTGFGLAAVPGAIIGTVVGGVGSILSIVAADVGIDRNCKSKCHNKPCPGGS